MSSAPIYHPYILPTILLVAGLSLKSPTIIRSWKDPNSRATWLVLLFASAVFVSVTPPNIQKINAFTGVPNIAAPWTYTMINAFCGACLTMLITWREEPSKRRESRIRKVWITYGAVVAGLWGTFLMADVPHTRTRDLDTFYANTPWMREHIALYLLGYLISTVVSAWMIWTWISKVREGWLRAGLVCLQLGHACGIVFVTAKFLAIGARWADADWDDLNVLVAPPFAILGGTLVALGFILPVVGPFLQQWPRDQLTYWTLKPLARAIRRVTPPAATAPVGRFAPLDLRLLQRQTQILDGLLQLAPHYDRSLYQKAYEAARAREKESTARGLAGALAICSAIESYGNRNGSEQSIKIGSEVTDHMESISRMLNTPHRLRNFRQSLFNSVKATPHAP
ncbi:MAB_1171c family putative transporter [Streptomyces sp. NPDC047315]|uniref:MAB_1171c family putative transporter n=1 Tax=Streptomyces sp. NPDC047315 TaxID=3155142 RepID=UPI0033D2D0AB